MLRRRGRDESSGRGGGGEREGRPAAPSAGAALPRSASAEKRARLEAWKAAKGLGGGASDPAPSSAAAWAPWDDPALASKPSAPVPPANKPPAATGGAPFSIPLSAMVPGSGLPPPTGVTGHGLALSGMGLTFAAAAKKAAAAAAATEHVGRHMTSTAKRAFA